MTRTRMILLGALLAVLSGCGGIPQANGGSGGCEESHRSEDNAWQGEQQTDNGAWQLAVQLNGRQNDDGAWQPPTQPYTLSESFTINHWTIEVSEIDYDATDQVLSALAERGLSYDGTPIEGWTWVVAEVSLTYGGPGVASPDAELESRYVDREGNVYIDFQCGMSDNFDGEVRKGQTATVFFGVPVPPEQVDGGFWGIGPADDTSVGNLVLVR